MRRKRDRKRVERVKLTNCENRLQHRVVSCLVWPGKAVLPSELYASNGKGYDTERSIDILFFTSVIKKRKTDLYKFLGSHKEYLKKYPSLFFTIYYSFSQKMSVCLPLLYIFSSLLSFFIVRHLRTLLPAQTSCRSPRLERQEIRKTLPRLTIWQMVLSGSRRACDTCHAWPGSPMPGIPVKFRKSRRRMSLPVRETTQTAFLSRNDGVWNIYDEKFSRSNSLCELERRKIQLW